MHKLTVKDFPDLELGDIRREKRFVSIINNLNAKPGGSIPELNRNWYDVKANYSFFGNEGVKIDLLKKCIAGFCRNQIGESSKMLFAHDVTNVSYNKLQAEGLGYLDNKEGRGIMCYSSIAIDPDGIPISLAYQHTWVRPLENLGKAQKRKQTKFEEKESYEWKRGIDAVNESLGVGIEKIHICDRGGDIYDLFFCGYEANTDLLVRSTHNRALSGGSPLWDTVAQEPAADIVTLDIPDPAGKKRVKIKGEVRYYQAQILRPFSSKSEYESVELTAIEIKQIGELEDWQTEAIHWKLLTTIEVTTTEMALQCVKWYCYRWLIERFHYLLKSGMQVEKLQLKQAESLQKAIHVYSIGAMRMMQMIYLSRTSPDLSCEVVLTKEKWAVLYMLTHRTKQIPNTPPTIRDAVQWIGKLGGHLGRIQDGSPGLKTVWKGYKALCDALEIYQILQT